MLEIPGSRQAWTSYWFCLILCGWHRYNGNIRVPLDNGVAISMDSKGAWRDNVFVERRRTPNEAYFGAQMMAVAA